MQERTVTKEAELDSVAEELLSLLPQKKGAHVITFSGELGAGKTALVKALARNLGIREHITSPTFVLMKRYSADHSWLTTLIHIDAYRVEDIDELRVLKLDERFIETGTLICIEWPERMEALIPESALPVTLRIEADGTRTVSYGS